jgi:hypothetical protein
MLLTDPSTLSMCAAVDFTVTGEIISGKNTAYFDLTCTTA